MRTSNPELHMRRRAEILAAAEHCFVKRGFHQSSMQNIADAAGVSMGLLYRYFANKEAIIEAAAEQDQADTLACIAALPDSGDSVSAWVRLIIDMAAQAAEPAYAGLANEILAESHRSPKIRALLSHNDTALAEAIVDKLKRQSATGAITLHGDGNNVAQSLMLISDGLIMRHFMTGSASDCVHGIEQMVLKILE